MALRMNKFRDIVEAEIFLRGGLIGTDVSKGVVGLVGKTISFTSPVGDVTFVTANRENDMLLLTDIKSQIEAVLTSGMRVLSVGGRIAFVHPSGTTAIALAATDQQAKSLLGFDQNSATSGKVYGVVPGTPPAYLSAYSADGAHVVVTNE